VDRTTGEVLAVHEPDRLVDVGPEPKAIRDRDHIWGVGREDKPGALVRELPDVVAARYRPWRKWKAHAAILARAYAAMGDEARARRVRFCGSTLRFRECPDGHEKRLAAAQFCRDRLCPLCQWRRSLVHRQAVRKVLAAVEEMEQVRYIFLTLTVPNVDEDELGPMLDRMMAALQAWTKTPEWTARVRGFVRALEITVNRQTLTFHPHFHLTLVVPDGPDGYFDGRRKGPLWWDKKQWQEAWQSVTGLPLAIVDVRPIQGMAAAAAEMTKYETKPASILRASDPEGTEWAVRVVGGALRNRRRVEWSGIMRWVRQRLLKADAIQDADGGADLVHIDVEEDPAAEACAVCGQPLEDRAYRWSGRVWDYVVVGREAATGPPGTDDLIRLPGLRENPGWDG
jgi:plasmid rolling circle replication initiator protein Rep